MSLSFCLSPYSPCLSHFLLLMFYPLRLEGVWLVGWLLANEIIKSEEIFPGCLIYRSPLCRPSPPPTQQGRIQTV